MEKMETNLSWRFICVTVFAVFIHSSHEHAAWNISSPVLWFNMIQLRMSQKTHTCADWSEKTVWWACEKIYAPWLTFFAISAQHQNEMMCDLFKLWATWYASIRTINGNRCQGSYCHLWFIFNILFHCKTFFTTRYHNYYRNFHAPLEP